MNTLLAVIIGALTVYLAYTFYARRIDRHVIQSDPKRATPATLYMDGVDFMPTNRNILFGYHFKSIAAAGPIIGAIVAANLWGWLPAIIWLILGVSFLGWASDYSGIVISVRNDGNSLSAIAHRLVSPRTRTILFVFIFFYLLLVAGAFVGIMATVLESQPKTQLGVIVLTVMGLLLGQMLYRWRTGLVGATVLTVGLTLIAILGGGWTEEVFKAFTAGLNNLSGGAPLVTYFDPTLANFKGADAKIMPSLLFWALAISAFCYAGSVLPIWRMAQPVIYVGFWITALAMVLGLTGALVAPFMKPEVAQFVIPAFRGFNPQLGPAGIMPLWPMLFVTIACGAISGWHALFGAVGTARQIQNEADMLPIGGGSMFAEFLLGLLALLAVSVGAKGGGHATPVPRPACDALRVARRRLPALPQPAHRLADLRRAGHSVDDDGHVGLSVAALRRREPDDGGAVAPAGDGVARVGREELDVRRPARGVHVGDHVRVDISDRVQSVLERLPDQLGCRPDDSGRRLRADDPGGAVAGRRGALHRSRHVAGLPAVPSPSGSAAEAGGGAGLRPSAPTSRAGGGTPPPARRFWSMLGC